MADKSKEDVEREEREAKERVEKRRSFVSRVMNPATYGIEPGMMTDPARVRDALINLRSGGVNLIGPETHLDYIPASYAISLRFAFVDAYSPAMVGKEGKKSNGYWYEQKGGGVSLTYVALNQLAHLAGLSWVFFERSDDGRTPLLWRFRGRAKVRLFDGSVIEEEGTGEADLRDSSAELAGLSDLQVKGMRAKGSQRGEGIAKAAIIRKLLALRGAFSWDEVDRPFVFPALVYMPPTGDAVINQMIAAKELGIVESLFGPAARRPASEATARVLALPDHGEGTDFGAETARLAERAPVRAPDGERMPWDRDDADGPPGPPAEAPPERKPEPAKGWEGTGYPEAIVREWCNAKGGTWIWQEAPSAQRRAWLVGVLTSDRGRADIDGFVGVKK